VGEGHAFAAAGPGGAGANVGTAARLATVVALGALTAAAGTGAGGVATRTIGVL
jgi:hypothetical protein